MDKPKKLVFFGNERLATGVRTKNNVINMLIKNGYDIAAIVIKDEPKVSRKKSELEIYEIAKIHNIIVLKPKKLTDITKELQELKAVAGILVAYGKMVPKSIIDLFPVGIINIHPSALPKHRGPIPIESVIMSGESETAVSIMQLAEAMDAGPVYVQQRLILNGKETKQLLSDKLLDLGANLLEQYLPQIIEGKIKPSSQNENKATYDQLIKKSDGVINWETPAVQIERNIRAFDFWPKSHAVIKGLDVIITDAYALEKSNQANLKIGDAHFDPESQTIQVTTKAGIICINTLKPNGKNNMPAQAFAKGYLRQLTN